ncbi:hypothetical protein KXW91_002725 [Aspergillus fumigatus]|nr:hypothetical protein KXX40_007484 [Aspergillus fumigatus]KAH2093837.1 hypothetical protein KXW86_004207 [Aspergillus fumigatus]KAH2350124.1 hypothetical protein KXW91_002725 [Aspergillus fumigatus]KAH2416643.1 hypothetical protein KXV44_000354 [Aspergillus fumigatus]KAH3294079.1 hypothetical protein KXW74_000968 [Aspergillus fumigatus]
MSSSPDAMSRAQPVGSVKLYSVLAGIMIATFLISLDVSIIATAIAAISTHFHATTDIGWCGATYPLTMCALQPISGKLSSLLSLRWTCLAFYCVFLLGSLICGVANSSKMCIIGRAVAGAGGSGVVSGGLSVIALITTPQQRPLFTGLVTSLYALGPVVAPIIGGALAEHNWRWCVLINLPGGAVTVVTLLLFFHPPRNPIRSGVMLLPSVCTQVFGSLVSGILAKHLRDYNPWLFLGSAFLCIANGLDTTFTVSSTSASWIGYQILQGLGCGLAAQIPLLTIQLVLKDEPRSIPVGIATVLFTQYFGSAVMQSIGGAIFQNALRRQLHQASLVDKQIEMLLNAGTSRVREVAVQAFPDRLADIIVAYNNAITPVFMML